MIRQIYNRQELPMTDLERIGLAKNGRLSLDEDDLNALLSGRRTDMLRLENLQADGIHIPVLDAKLSLRLNAAGDLELLVHPIYKEIEPPYFLTAEEAQQLEKGEQVNIDKVIVDKEGNAKEVLVEFDRETNEFIITDTEKILAPEEINGLPLTPEQKERYRKGREVETADGTTIQYAAKEKQGIRSDRLALIASVLIDGGVSYLLFKGLNALFNKPQKKEPGANYHKTLSDISRGRDAEPANAYRSNNDQDEEQTESISR
jgi:hypothetical protein